jgi:Flp pilus assembly protein CpaB
MTKNRRRRRRSGFPFLLIVLGLLGLAAGGGLWATGGSFDFLGSVVRAQEEPDGPGPGQVAVPISATTIPAYTRVTRDHLLRTDTLDVAILYLDAERVEELGILTRVTEVLGRVTEDQKPAGYAFRESDFLPKGTQPGLVAGIPAGMRGLTIEAEAIRGLATLGPGDRFDVLAAQPLDTTEVAGAVPLSGVFADRARAEASFAGGARRARVDVLVQNGVVVSPLRTRQVPVSSASLTQGLTTRTKPVQELTVAVRPEEVAPLMEAMAVEAELTCAPRSGRPDDASDSLTPALEPELPSWLGGPGGSGGLSLVDRIDGGERRLVPVPSRGPTGSAGGGDDRP